MEGFFLSSVIGGLFGLAVGLACGWLTRDRASKPYQETKPGQYELFALRLRVAELEAERIRREAQMPYRREEERKITHGGPG